MNSNIKNNWSLSFFNNLYLELFMKRNKEEILKEVKLIKSLLSEKRLNSLLDVCCGIGDLSSELSRDLQISATGIEYSLDYVKRNYISNIIHGDAREKQTSEKFDLVLNWFSSFSYFSKEDNLKILQNCFEYCSDTFLLEYYNPFLIMKNYQSEFVYYKNFNNIDYKINRKCFLDPHSRQLNQEWIFYKEQSTTPFECYNTTTFLYFPDEIKNMLYEIGFKNIEIYGHSNYKLEEASLSSSRIIIKGLV